MLVMEVPLGACQDSLSSQSLLLQFLGAPQQSPTAMFSSERDEHLVLISAVLRGLQHQPFLCPSREPEATADEALKRTAGASAERPGTGVQGG